MSSTDWATIPKELIELARLVLGERYVIEEEIGRGGAARVFRAVVRDGGARVALKILRPELMASLTARRFLREIEVLKQLHHPHTAELLDFGEADWLVYYVMAYVEGPTLRAFLNKHGQAPLAPTLAHSAQVLDAVAHAHTHGIVHRDVKPENIVLAKHGAVLLDFGIARAVAVSEEQKVTRSGFTVGTSAYMSPEQAAGQDVDHRSDIYALGCVLYECLAGKPPFSHPLDAQVMMMQQRAEVPDIRRVRAEVGKALAAVIARALEKDPDRRWQTAGDMREAMLAAG